MEWLFWIAAALLVWLIAGYIRAEVGYRRMVSEWREAEPALDDHRLTVWERLPLYDHEERGDFSEPLTIVWDASGVKTIDQIRAERGDL